MWQSSPPGSIYDYIRVASFSIGPDGLIEQWSRRAAGLFGMASDEVVGRDPVEAFMPAELRPDAHRRVGEILDGKEWTGLVPFRIPGENAVRGLAEIYVMPSETGAGERAALCIVVDVRALRRIETDLAASQAIFGQSPSVSSSSVPISPSCGPTSASPPSSGARPTTIGAAPWRTTWPAPRPSVSPPPSSGCWRPARRSPTSSSSAPRPAPWAGVTGP